MWRWYTLLSFRPLAHIEGFEQAIAEGGERTQGRAGQRNHHAFYSAAADLADAKFINRSRSGVRMMSRVACRSADGYRVAVERQRRLGAIEQRGEPIEGGGVRVDGVVIGKGLKLPAGTFVVQVETFRALCCVEMPLAHWTSRDRTGVTRCSANVLEPAQPASEEHSRSFKLYNSPIMKRTASESWTVTQSSVEGNSGFTFSGLAGIIRGWCGPPKMHPYRPRSEQRDVHSVGLR
jgi:hypothetical protein